MRSPLPPTFPARAALAAFMLAAAATSAPAQDRPPNILLILGADHAIQSIGAYGSRTGATPHLDRLAERGMVFTRAYTPAPLNAPARLAILTGRYPHTLGISRMYTGLGDDAITIGDALRLSGYWTYALGMMHFEDDVEGPPRPFVHGFRHESGLRELLERAIGREVQPLAAGIRVKARGMQFRDPAALWLNAANLPVGRREIETASYRLASEAVRRLQSRARSREPFILIVGFNQPLAPFNYPVDFRPATGALFEAADFDPPAITEEERAEMPLLFRELTREDRRGVLATYTNTVAFLDRCIGIVLDGLDEAGLAGDTLVIYTADNGYHLGDRGRFEKQSLFEAAVRVPLIVRWPGVVAPGSRADGLVETVDLAATLTEAAGGAEIRRLSGRSLMPILTGATGRGRSDVFSEYLETESAMIRDERFKLIFTTGRRLDLYRADHETHDRGVRLYDLGADPDERVNLAQDPIHAARVEAMKRTLLERLRQTHANGPELPASATLDERIDLYLVPREVWRDLRGRNR